MALWFGNPTLEAVRATQNIGAMRLVGIQITALGDDYISGSLAVTEQLLQPYGILHGGINIVLAETLGSTAAAMTLDMSRFGVVGQEINANHLRPALPGRRRGIQRRRLRARDRERRGERRERDPGAQAGRPHACSSVNWKTSVLPRANAASQYAR